MALFGTVHLFVVVNLGLYKSTFARLSHTHKSTFRFCSSRSAKKLAWKLTLDYF